MKSSELRPIPARPIRVPLVLENVGIEPKSMVPDEWAARVATEIARWHDIAQAANINLD